MSALSTSSDTASVCAHVLISGKVQGVCYRAATREKAVAIGLCGWVRNLRDGRVEAVFEGPPATISQMINWCHQGPPAALVEAVQVDYQAATGLIGFQITDER